MFARASTFRGDPAGLDTGIDYVETEVMAELGMVDGFVGLSMMVERGQGECIATTSWETADAMRASGDRLTEVRNRFGGLVHAPAKVQEWEIAAMHRAATTPAERWCRVVWLKIEPDVIDRGVDVYCSELLPRIQKLPGYASASLLVDRVRGRACSTSCFGGLEAMQLSRDEAWAIREAGIREVGVDIMDVAEYELAVAHLRVPETVGVPGGS